MSTVPRSFEAEPEGNRSSSVGSVKRAIRVLTLFVEGDASTLGVTEIANRSGLSKAVVHRLLTALGSGGLISWEPDTRRYRLGPMVLTLGLAYLSQLDIREMARDEMRRLSDSTQETATLSVRSEWSRTYVDQVTPSRELKMTVDMGRPFPLHAGSSGKAFLAFLSEEEQDRFFDENTLEAVTDLTVTSVKNLRTQLNQIRSDGFASTFGERQLGAASVAAPILDHEGTPIAVMSVCGPVERFRSEWQDAADRLVTVTTDLSIRLGFSPED